MGRLQPVARPQARDFPGFDWWSQAIASRGYVVLHPQFRGSDGFGVEHIRAGDGQWGKLMQTDLSDGVRYLAGQGMIDPKRVCINGWSYGGYAAMAGATLDTGIYRCAIAGAAIGCSGMAGSFGLKKENFRNCIRAGWDLISTVREADWTAGTTECSACKMQMEQGTSKPTIHPLKLLALSYRLMPELDQLLAQRSRELTVT